MAQKLRKEDLCCGDLEVFLYTKKHREDNLRHFHRRPIASSGTLEIVGAATRIARMLFRPGIKYRKAGVIATRLVPQQEVQTNLFVPAHDRLGRLAKVINEVNLYKLFSSPYSN